MGYHATVQTALVTLLDAALEAPVLNGLALDDAQALRLGKFVAVVRESIDFEDHPQINPATDAHNQHEDWAWALHVKGGGGAADRAGKGAEVDETLESIRTALNAQRLTSDCGPLRLVSEEYAEEHGTGVVYTQRWKHTRRV